MEQLAATLDGVLSKSVADQELSTKVADDFRRLVGQKAQHQVEKVDCGEHFCRLVTKTGSRDLQRGLGYLLSGHEPFDHGVLYRYDYEGLPARTTLYVARAGEDLMKLAAAD